MIDMIEYIGSYAIILRKGFNDEGIHFFTPSDYSQQLGYMKRKAGYVISPHKHNAVKREVTRTQEVLFVKSGLVNVNIYDDDDDFFAKRQLLPGDIILLARGGHGFECLLDSEIIEIKQGPYAGDQDKTYL